MSDKTPTVKPGNALLTERRTTRDAPSLGVGARMEDQRISPAYPYRRPLVAVPDTDHWGRKRG